MPSATRWCPTPEQVMILEEIYRRGMTTPRAPQVQQITSYLSSYGKVEGKNVFYWFQNHKARERQKLRKKHMIREQQLMQVQQTQHVQFLHHFGQSTEFMAYFPHCYLSQEELHGASSTEKREDISERPIPQDKKMPLRTLELFPTKSTSSIENECMHQI